MQLNMDVLYIPWPCGEDTKVEPIGFMFMMTFGIIMVVQIIGMLVHRTTTFLHIMATTVLQCFGKNDETNTESMVQLAKQLGRIDDINKMTLTSMAGTLQGTIASDGRGSMMGDDIRKAQRKIVYMIDKNVERRRKAMTMSVSKAFERRLNKLNWGLEKGNELDLDNIQRRLLGGATAGFLVNRQTEAALKTYRNMRNTVRESSAPGTVTSAEYSADYGSNISDSIRSRGRARIETDDDDDDYGNQPQRTGTRKGVGSIQPRNGTLSGSRQHSVRLNRTRFGRHHTDVRQNPMFNPSDVPEAGYGQ